MVTALAAGGGYLLATSGDDEAADAGVAAGEEILREQERLAQRERNDRLERKLERLERKAESEQADQSGDGSGGGAGEQRSFAKLAAKLGGSVGVAYGRPGVGQSATTLGDFSSGPAWSTIKVPIAVATVRAGTGTDAQRRSAITASDNAAAEALWSSLGAPSTAGRRTEAVLADAGDGSTSVQTRKTRPQFTSFGQTDWALADAQRFVAGLPCVKGSDPIIDLMGQVVAGQRWGLGSAGSNQRFKGGWGPDESGAYLVRQIGLIDTGGGTLAVALAAKPSDGSFETGKRQLDQLAAWVTGNAKGAGSTKC